MTPARRNPARKDESVQLSAMFAEAGWAPADQHFRERPFVIWHGSFYSVSGTPPNGSPCSKACQTAEEVLEFLTSKTVVVASSSNIATDSPDTAPWASPDVRAALDPFVPMEADAVDPEKELLRARIAEFESRPPEIREVTVEKIVERVVEVPAAVVEEAPEPEPYTPDFTLIPDALAKFAEADETAADFRNRLKRLWQRFGIADGEHFPGGGEPLTGDEKITMREIDIVLNSDEGRNAGLLHWLRAEEQNA